MLIEGMLYMLNNYSPLTAIVGNRITPSLLPKNWVVPALTYFQVTGSNDVTLDKAAVITDHIEIDVWANSYSQAKYAQQALCTLWDAFTGVLNDGTVVIYAASNTNPDFYESDSLLYRSSTTFIFMHL